MNQYMIDLSIALIGSLFGGIITIIGVYITIKYTKKLNHTEYLLNYNEAKVHIDNFIERAEYVYNLQNSKERNRSYYLYHINLIEMHEYYQSVLKKLNDSYNEADKIPINNILRLANENAPYDLYKDLNGLIINMAILYNLLVEEVEPYLNSKNINKIDVGFLTGKHHYKEIKRLKKKYKKLNRKLKL